MGSPSEVRAVLLGVVDLAKSRGITAVFTSVMEEKTEDAFEIGVSSLMDTWLSVRDIESGGERNRGLFIIKSRGMDHSNQIREFLITDRGVTLEDVYLGTGGVLTGSARLAQETREQAEAVQREHEIESRRRALERKKALAESQIAVLSEEAEADEEELARMIAEEASSSQQISDLRRRMAVQRRVDRPSKGKK